MHDPESLAESAGKSRRSRVGLISALVAIVFYTSLIGVSVHAAFGGADSQRLREGASGADASGFDQSAGSGGNSAGDGVPASAGAVRSNPPRGEAFFAMLISGSAPPCARLSSSM